jgi:hypothetical protein
MLAVTVPLPLLLAPAVMAIQASFVAAVHAHAPVADTEIDALPPAALAEKLPGLIE